MFSLRPKPGMYMICGLPCSGKTTFAEYTKQTRGYNVVSTDDAMYDLHQYIRGGNVKLYSNGEEAKRQIFSAQNSRALMGVVGERVMIESSMRVYESLRKGKDVAVEGVFGNSETRTHFLALVRSACRDFRPDAYWMHTGLDECLQRFASRTDHKIVGRPEERKPAILTEDVIRGVYHNSSLPSRREGFHDVFLVEAIDGGYRIEDTTL